MAKKIKLKVSSRLIKKRSKRFGTTLGKHCRFCSDKQAEQFLDYKNTPLLKHFLTERGKILPSHISGNCAQHQRSLAAQIKVARTIALLPYSSQGR